VPVSHARGVVSSLLEMLADVANPRDPRGVRHPHSARRRFVRWWRTRHRTKVTEGPGSRAAGLVMTFKLIESAQTRWRAVNAPQLVALVRAGASFTGGKRVVRPGQGRGRGDRLRVA
jgi:hypothetical protein